MYTERLLTARNAFGVASGHSRIHSVAFNTLRTLKCWGVRKSQKLHFEFSTQLNFLIGPGPVLRQDFVRRCDHERELAQKSREEVQRWKAEKFEEKMSLNEKLVVPSGDKKASKGKGKKGKGDNDKGGVKKGGGKGKGKGKGSKTEDDPVSFIDPSSYELADGEGSSDSGFFA